MPVATQIEARAHERIFEDISNRLSRVEGHVRGIKRMWQEGKDCPDVLLQIGAVQAALKQIGRMILEEHIESCLHEAGRRGGYDQALAALKDALRQYV
jgi:DNA-binding FrmR family transcriptional regulator